MQIRHLYPALGSALLLAAAACKTDAPAPNSPTGEVAEPVMGDHSTHAMGAGPSMGPRTRGVPHSNNIDKVVLSQGGDMALSRDSLGGIRFWPALDGKAEPMLMPIRGSQRMSLARSSTGATIAAIDGVGSLHILAAKADGSMKELYMSSPHAPMVQAEVLQGGEKLVALTSDHKILLMDDQGRTLSSIQERRFNPRALHLNPDGQSLIAMSADTLSGEFSVSLQPVSIDGKANQLKITGDEMSVDHISSLDPERLSISPDGAHFAFLGFPQPEQETSKKEPPAEQKPAAGPALNRRRVPVQPPHRPGTGASLMIASLSDGEVRKVDLNLPQHEQMQVGLGFVSDDTLVVSSRPSGGTWRVQLGEEFKTLPLQATVANDPQRSAHAFAQGVHLAADGTWLFVQRPLEGKHHYLGYTAFDPQYASISPNSERVAWTNNAMIYVESTNDDSKSLRITAAPTEAYYRAAFIDDEHLVAVDYSGGLHLIDWKKGEEVGAIDTGGSIREFEVDQERKLIRGVRQNGGSWVCEMGNEGLKGPYLILDNGFRSGFLGGNEAIWTIDSANRYHSYGLTDLRAGLSPKDLEASALPLKQGAPMAIDKLGYRYSIRPTGSVNRLVIEKKGAKEQAINLPWVPLRVLPSPDGSMVGLVSSNGGIVKVYDRGTGKSLWSVSFVQGVREFSWSQDSKSLAVASQVGAVVYEGATGEEIRMGCGHWFEKRATPPPSTASFMQVQNLCER